MSEMEPHIAARFDSSRVALALLVVGFALPAWQPHVCCAVSGVVVEAAFYLALVATVLAAFAPRGRRALPVQLAGVMFVANVLSAH